MSHFSVLVIDQKEELTHERLTELLQPFHEFESTGTDDQHVVDVDKTAELLAEYEKDEVARLRTADGTLLDPYLDEHYRDPTPEEQEKIGLLGDTGFRSGFSYHSRDWGDGRGYRPRVRFVPEGAEEVSVPASQAMTLLEFAGYSYGMEGDRVVRDPAEVDTSGPHKFGHVLAGEHGSLLKFVRRTNPNKKWDHWTLGGRWTGFFRPGYEPSEDPANQETCWLCGGTGVRTDDTALEWLAAGKVEPKEGLLRITIAGAQCNGCRGTGKDVKYPGNWKNVGCTLQVRDLDLHALREAAAARALEVHDRRLAIVAGRELPDTSWTSLEGEAHASARDAFWKHPVISDLLREWLDLDDIRQLFLPREKVAERAREGALQTFAVLLDGKWHQRGEMGWWGVVHEEKDEDKWRAEHGALVSGLSPDTWLAVVDCHI